MYHVVHIRICVRENGANVYLTKTADGNCDCDYGVDDGVAPGG